MTGRRAPGLALVLALAAASVAAAQMAPTQAAPSPSPAPSPAGSPSPAPLSNTLKWSTASEVENFGYDVYRSEKEDGPFVRINTKPIAGAGTLDEPSFYEYVDTDIDPTKGYFYYVVRISLKGVRDNFTPDIKAKAKRPLPGATPAAPSGPAPAGSPSSPPPVAPSPAAPSPAAPSPAAPSPAATAHPPVLSSPSPPPGDRR
jgi:hypothetical protein